MLLPPAQSQARALALSLLSILTLFPAVAFAGVDEEGNSQAQAPAPAVAAKNGWTSDFNRAKARAVHTGADLMICFTVRDWSAVCRRFESDYLYQQEFINRAGKRFVLVHFDLSTEEEGTDGAQMRGKLEVGGFPTLVLTNSQGLPYAMTGFRPESVENYVEHIERLHDEHRERQQLLARAADAEGPARAVLLAQALPNLGEHRTAKFYGDMMREIIELDPNDESGKVDELKYEIADLAYVLEMRRLDGEFQWMKMVELTDKHIEEMNLTGSRKQAALMNRFDINRRQGDLRAMIKSLQEVLEVNPYNPHGRQASQILQSLAGQLQL